MFFLLVIFKVAPLGNRLLCCACKCYKLNAIFTCVFTPSCSKLITYNKQRLNSFFLSSLLKLWGLVFNHKCPPKCVVLPFYGFICDNLEFPSGKSSKMFTAHHIQWDTNFKHEKVGFVKADFSIFANICLLPFQKNCSYRFP